MKAIGTIINIVTKDSKRGPYENWTLEGQIPKYMNLWEDKLLDKALKGKTYEIEYTSKTVGERTFHNVDSFVEVEGPKEAPVPNYTPPAEIVGELSVVKEAGQVMEQCKNEVERIFGKDLRDEHIRCINTLFIKVTK